MPCSPSLAKPGFGGFAHGDSRGSSAHLGCYLGAIRSYFERRLFYFAIGAFNYNYYGHLFWSYELKVMSYEL